MLPLEGDRKPLPYLQTPFREHLGQFSPDGRWVAYFSNESGGYQIYVQGFPKSGAKFMVSAGGGVRPRWRRDGKELYYLFPGRVGKRDNETGQQADRPGPNTGECGSGRCPRGCRRGFRLPVLADMEFSAYRQCGDSTPPGKGSGRECLRRHHHLFYAIREEISAERGHDLQRLIDDLIQEQEHKARPRTVTAPQPESL